MKIILKIFGVIIIVLTLFGAFNMINEINDWNYFDPLYEMADMMKTITFVGALFGISFGIILLALGKILDNQENR